MSDLKQFPKEHSRSEVIHDTIVLQLKLIVDGVRDLLLMPVAFFAAVLGLIMHKKKPGRYFYRLLNYGKISEQWIGLFEEAHKDNMEKVDLKDNSLQDLLNKTQSAIESKYLDETKKQNLLNSLNKLLDTINTKVNPTKKGKNEEE